MTSIIRLDSASHGCEAVYEVRDPGVGLQAWIAVHDRSRGPGVGGVRRRRYPSSDAAIADATSLAQQMTWKTRFASLPCGGAKSVILDVPGMDLERVYRAFGRAVTSLEGGYFCGPDVGTGARELGWIRDQTRFVNAASNDASEATARGVLAGIRACLAYRWAGAERPLTVLVQGLGRVGTRVVSGLVGANRHITGCDPVATAVSSTRQAHPGMEVIDPSHSDSHPCDLFVPCAVGPVVTASNVGQLPYQVICGSANTQLAHMDLAARLRGAGILYAPDFVVNAGAVIEGVLVQFEPGPDVRARVQARIDGIEGRCRTLFRDAESLGRAPAELAQEMVQS